MKTVKHVWIALLWGAAACTTDVQKDTAEDSQVDSTRHLFMDVHNFEPGDVTYDAVADAHVRDLAVEGKYGVHFLKYWVDEAQGKVYCLAESPDSESMYNTHKEAHGLTPDHIHQVSEGQEAVLRSNGKLFFDVHYIGPGKVTAQAVAEAHLKDLATQDKYHVNFVNYWVDEKQGIVMCLAEAPDSAAMINTHKEAHGLIPDEIHQVMAGH